MRRFIAALLLTGLGRAALAQQPADTLRLTLDGAVQRALERGVELRLARADVLEANGAVREALSAALPQVTGSLTYSRQFASIYQGVAADTSSIAKLFQNTPFGAPNTWNLQIQASQLLWSGGKVGAALSAAKSVRQVAALNQAETAADITFQVKRAYWNAALQRRLLAIAVENLDQARQHLREVQLFRQAGTRAEYDQLRAQVEAANQEPQVVQARNEYDIAMLELKRLLDVPAEQAVALETTPDSPDATIPVLATDSLGGPDRPGLAAAEFAVSEQEQLLKVARANRWPTLSLSTTYTEQAFPADVFPAVDQTRRQVELEVAQARAEVDRARALIVARRETVRQAQRAQHLAGVRYANGMATQLEVSDARVAQQQAEVNEVQATRDYFVALARLERALGRPVPVVQQPIERLAQASHSGETQP